MTEKEEAIKVVVRFKGSEELAEKDLEQWEVTDNQVRPRRDVKVAMSLQYDFVCVESPQSTMYKHAARDIVRQFTRGYNGTIFAYGQSGSGKTFSMLGPETVVDVIKNGGQIAEEYQNLYGIIPRSIIEIFDSINDLIEETGAQFQLALNYFEIYNEVLVNLLDSSGQDLRIATNQVVNANPTIVSSPEQIFELIQRGQQTVQYASTNLNDRSSRSHTILVLYFKQIN